VDPRVQQVLDQFLEVFADPTGLPPSLPCDHNIPLIPSAHPFNIRAYRYPLALKDEIEQQVKEMLAQGVIQKIQCPFASLVLLVKKKDHRDDSVLITDI
jgi:tRNA A37 N6-isopentenylltransferase MiaA